MPGNNSTLQSTSAHETSRFFSWTTVQKFYNAMPLEITPCKNVYEAKMYTAALLAVLSIVFLPMVVAAFLVYSSAKKGSRG